MKREKQGREKLGMDHDGIRIVERPGGRGEEWSMRTKSVAAAVVLTAAGGVLTFLWHERPGMPGVAPAPPSSVSTPAAASSPAAAAPLASRRTRDVRTAAATAPGEAAETVARPSENKPVSGATVSASLEKKRKVAAAAEQMLQRAIDEGKTEGIAAFPPPGTNPIKLGIVVPRNYEVPEGYIRHYQFTDDGRRLEPVLMFSPDYEFTDASGKPVALPEDGIVPENMAPSDLPVRKLAMPKHPYGASLDPE